MDLYEELHWYSFQKFDKIQILMFLLAAQFNGSKRNPSGGELLWIVCHKGCF